MYYTIMYFRQDRLKVLQRKMSFTASPLPQVTAKKIKIKKKSHTVLIIQSEIKSTIFGHLINSSPTLHTLCCHKLGRSYSLDTLNSLTVCGYYAYITTSL